MACRLARGWGRRVPALLLVPGVGLCLCGALLLFPLAGVIADWRTRGRVHPGWWVGIDTIVTAQFLIEIVGRSALGLAIAQDRKSVVEGKSVSVRVDLGGRRILKKKKETRRQTQASMHHHTK